MNEANPLIELYATGYLIDVAAKHLDVADSEQLRRRVSTLLEPHLQEALTMALAEYWKAKVSRTPPHGYGMDELPPGDSVPGVPAGNDPILHFRCRAQCPACKAMVTVVNAQFLDESRCVKCDSKYLILKWKGE